VKNNIEILAPGGDINSIKAAIYAGANAVYCGLDRFNARNRAENISFDDLLGVLNYAHKNNCKVYLTLNIIILENEMPSIIEILNKLLNTTIDGIIVQDLGVLYILSKYFKSHKIHASTQLTTHNQGQLKFLSEFNVSRVNLSRELNISEIKNLSIFGRKHNISTEVFVHGSYCICFSGICYMSSVNGANSGNRGRCSQPCRDKYLTTSEGKNYPLNIKDNSAYFDFEKLYDAGVYSLKIEGRIKGFDYVFTVVDTWKKRIQNFYNNRLLNDDSNLFKVFNRGFSNAYLKGEIDKDMFIDNPRDNSITHLLSNNYSLKNNIDNRKIEFFNEKGNNKINIENSIKNICITKVPLTIIISGECGLPLKVIVKTPDNSFEFFSDYVLESEGLQPLNKETILKKWKAINNTEYFIQNIDLSEIKETVYLNFKELASIRKKILLKLTGLPELYDNVTIPELIEHKREDIKPTLSVLISSINDALISEKLATIYFQLPSSFNIEDVALIDVFIKNKNIIPWFTPIIIGNDFNVAIEFIEKLKPKIIVANNTGIAYEAYKRGIDWIAGPYLNITNSYSLLCLKEKFNCYGAFISNEINKNQIKSIKPPDNFKLFYSIYHPIELMTSRQCLFHQVIGCDKNIIDEECVLMCNKSTTITNINNDKFYIVKTKGSYNSIYNSTNYLNTDIVFDFNNMFSSFFIDLRNIATETKIEIDKSILINYFKSLINGNIDSKNDIYNTVNQSTNQQYKVGI